MIEGIDVSGANGTSIDWRAVRRSGRRFVVLKINEGDLLEATTTTTRVEAIRKAGLLIGGYDYVHPKPGRTGAQEFQIHYQAARRVGLYRKGDMRPVLDLECSHFDTSCQAGRRDTIGYVRSWVQECLRVTGQHPILYMGFFWRDELQDPLLTLGCQLWYPSYPTLRLVPRAWGAAKVALHQYSEHGQVPGIHGQVDLDRFLTSRRGPFAIRDFKSRLCLKRGPR